MKINAILFRIAIIVFAVGFTIVTFGFWGKFGGALDSYLTMETKPDKPKYTGVVTMTIVQPNQKPSCDKQHPCPKP
ncbi:MAG TPA: hypothetical protein VID67_02310 [Rhizomicrobium sp.]|jgi:hypothetical protein